MEDKYRNRNQDDGSNSSNCSSNCNRNHSSSTPRLSKRVSYQSSQSAGGSNSGEESRSEDSFDSVPTTFGDEHMVDPSRGGSNSNSNNNGSKCNNNYNSSPGSQSQQNTNGLGRKETKAVWWLKGVVLTVLIVAAIIVGIVTFQFTRNKEVELFQNQFLDDSARLKSAYYEVSAQRIWVGMSLMVRLVSQSAMTGVPLINQALVDFDYSGIPLLHLSKGDSLAYAPLIRVDNRSDWEAYAMSPAALWMTISGNIPSPSSRGLEEGIWRLNGDIQPIDEPKNAANQEFLAPMWQVTPLRSRRPSVLFNMLSEPIRRTALVKMMRDKLPTLTGILNDDTEAALQEDFESTCLRSISMFPILNMFRGNDLAGVIAIEWRWAAFFENILQDKSAAVMVVIESTSLNALFTLEVVGSAVNYVGEGDLHDARFENLRTSSSFDDFAKFFATSSATFQLPPGLGEYMTVEDLRNQTDRDPYRVHFYPTSRFEESFTSNRPAVFTTAVLMIFVFTTLVFLVYDCLVERRQSVVLDSAVKHTSLVHELYPPDFVNGVIQARCDHHHHHATTTTATNAICPIASTSDDHLTLDTTEETGRFRRRSLKAKMSMLQPMQSLQTFLMDTSSESTPQKSQPEHLPIAEMFPDVTVLFADICGFTAWSSEREPIQVFQLLEALFGAFDEAGKRLGVFKVETIGDCYVAVCGLPVPHSSHAVVMCRFANEILQAMDVECKKLEVQLGPGTSELNLRIGLHSGSVIAGVLRGEKSRFQLFGDLMNTCARIESTGEPGKTQVSKTTADLLIDAGKRYWVTPRAEMVQAKGKGQLQTYWVSPKRKGGKRKKRSSHTSRHVEKDKVLEDDDKFHNCDNVSWTSGDWGKLSLDGDYFGKEVEGKQERLIEWNTEILVTLLNKLIARRAKEHSKEDATCPPSFYLNRTDSENSVSSKEVSFKMVELPPFDPTAAVQTAPDLWTLSSHVRDQLRDYIVDIADLYNDLPFHNFEHASHVTLSSLKLLNRIVAAGEGWDTELAEKRHTDTYGIATDPLTHFVVVLAALIHDVGHPGVPNSQLVSDNHTLCQMYGDKSVAERHSIQIALEVLQKYPELQECIYTTPAEHDQFYQLLHHSVLATDIMDSDSSHLWSIAFGSNAADNDTLNERALMNRKASIVLEQIIQASDVAHTMQHWHIYRKWNEMLFEEFYVAFRDGSTTYDPRKNWYEGEMRFLDNYVLPLANRLKESGVFGVSSEEYLQHAVANREEWEQKGQAVTEAMMKRISNREAAVGEMV